MIRFVWTFSGRLITRTWAWIGFRNPKFELPVWVVALALAVAAVATVAAAVRARPGRSPEGGPRRADVAFAWLAVALLLTFVVRRAWGLYETTGNYAFIQGRYLYSALVGPMAVVGLGLAALFRRRAVPLTLAATLTLQAWVLAEVVHGSWSGPGPLGPAPRHAGLEPLAAHPGRRRCRPGRRRGRRDRAHQSASGRPTDGLPQAAGRRERRSSRTRRAAAGMLVPGPKMAATPAAVRAS